MILIVLGTLILNAVIFWFLKCYLGKYFRKKEDLLRKNHEISIQIKEKLKTLNQVFTLNTSERLKSLENSHPLLNPHELTRIMNLIQEIEERAKTIHHIVSQTKLLSVKASLEASKSCTNNKTLDALSIEMASLAEKNEEAANELSKMLNFGREKVRLMIDKHFPQRHKDQV